MMMNRDAQLLGTETRKANSVGGTLKRLGGYFRPYAWLLLLIGALIVASTYMQVQIPELTGQAVDCYLGPYAAKSASELFGGAEAPTDINAVITAPEANDGAFSNCTFADPSLVATANETLAGLTRLILIIVAFYVGSAIVSGLSFYLMSAAGYRVLRDLQAEVFAHIQQLSLGYFNKHEAGDVMSRFTSDIDTLQQVVGFGLISVLSGALLIVWTVIAMLRLDAPFALISLVTLAADVLATKWFSDQARKAFRRARMQIGNVNADLQESISSVREVQAFSREDENIEQFRVSNASNRDANIQAQIYTSALAPTLEALGYVSLAIVAGVGGVLMLSQQSFLGSTVSIGLIIAFIGYTQQFNRPVQQISTLWANLQSAIAGSERIFGLLDASVDITDKPDAIELPSIQGHVQYQKVWAEYNPGEPILRGIDIEAKPGQTIAIVGPTGAGKTTIINLLPRFWDVSDGAIKIDGYDIRDVTLHSLRQQIGIVLQDSFLFSDSVTANIRYGRPEATDEEVIAAAKLAHAHEFIERLPDGYDTILGERGSGLSQGQRQLLSIARVALVDPRILILDEATSSVDTRTEQQIQQALEVLLKGRTSFVIAHRLSTIRHADQVLVVKDGEIIEQGTHDELLEANGFYYDLYMSQFRRKVDDGEVEEGVEAAEELDGYLVAGD